MLVSEIFNTQTDYDVVKSTKNTFQAKFVTKAGNKIWFEANFNDVEWDIVFYVLKQSSTTGREHPRFGLTGNKEQFEVLSFVGAALKEFVVRYSPDVIKFTADKENDSNTRANVYAKLIKSLSLKYEITQINKPAYSEFVLTRM